ncbi:uncharacterized protein [Montipora foliosa]|uniref:uncharacterized protein n=1 Tax=Montipora foliosa TaxID=591990 RepID=UPI0035F111FE
MTLTISPGHLLLAGDFNFHVHVPDDSDVSSFLDFLDLTSLKQHVTTTTHILDLLMTKASDNFISSTKVTFDLPSDHAMVTCNLAVPRPKPTKILVNHRKLRSVNTKDLQHDIRSSLPPTKLPENIDEQVNLYNTTLQGLLDSQAPRRTRFVTLRPHAPWFDDGLRTAKQEKRRCERRWRKSGLEVHRQIYQQQCAVYWNLLENAKTAYRRATVEGCDDRDLFRVVNKFVDGKKLVILPSMDDNALRDAFLRFFSTKIDDLQASLVEALLSQLSDDIPTQLCSNMLTNFSTITRDTTRDIIMNSSTKSCTLDPLPTCILKDCLDVLLVDPITSIINSSILTGKVPSTLKTARVTPVIKKPTLDPEVFKNYRPISNSPFLIKTIERVIAKKNSLPSDCQ